MLGLMLAGMEMALRAVETRPTRSAGRDLSSCWRGRH